MGKEETEVKEVKEEVGLKPRAKFDPKEFLFFFRNVFLSTQNTIGIDVGQGYIKIVQLQKSRGGYLLTDYRVRAIPYKIKDNIRERTKFIKEFVSEFISQSRIKTQLGRLAIKGAGIFVFSFTLPPLADKDLRGAVGIELKKRLPFQIDFNNISFNYFVTERFEEENNASVLVSCLAADNGVVDKNLEFLKGFGLRPVAINSSYDALGNLVGVLAPDKYVAVLDMGVKQSYLNFYKGSALQFNREIPIGGEQLTIGILKVLSPLGENITIEDAEAFKRQCGIPMQEEVAAEFYTDFGAVKGEQIITSLRPTLERMITEVSRTITFHFRTYKIESLDALYLTGGASRIKNIDRFLQANLSNLAIKSIEKLNPLKAIKGWFDAGVLKQELVMEEAAPHLATAFGLCLNKGGLVNFVPPKEKMEQKALSVMLMVRLAFPVFLTVLLLIYIGYYMNYLRYESLIIRTQSQIKQASSTVDDINEYFAQKKDLEEKESLLSKAIGRQPLWNGILKEISRITPDSVTLKQVEVKAADLPRRLHIKGEVYSEYSNLDLAVSQYTLDMNDSPYFGNAEIVSNERDIYSSVPKATFEIVCDLKV